MIDEIHVQNLALIRQATLLPSTGLTVLTGETGAGKTALLTAIKLLLGGRADKDSVREGSERLTCEGRFLHVPARDAEGSLIPNAFEDEMVVSRSVAADGKSRASLDGRMASAKQLAEVLSSLVDLCGQHDQQQLLKPATHGKLLDAWMGMGNPDSEISALKRDYEQAFRQARAAADELERVREAGKSSSAALEEARFVLKRIDEVNPQPGEYEELESNLARAEHAEALATAANTAYRCLSGEEGSLDSLYAAAQALEGVSRYDARLGEAATALNEAAYVLEDVSREVRDYRDSVEFDPDELALQHERMSAFIGLMRAYGPRMEDVFDARSKAADLVSLVDDGAQREKAAQLAVDQAEKVLFAAAQALAAARAQAAPAFSSQVSGQMSRLEMAHAQLDCQVEDLPRAQWTLAGSQQIEFAFRPGKGMQPRPLARIASGGELSRVLLAVKVVLGEQDSAETLIFDEVDAGVGGATAVALAEVLADLATTHQVLVVTHLAQVAVRADAHYVVRKLQGDVPETQLVQVQGEDRVAEVARMLSGDNSEAALSHARELLAE